jgi:uncharacterized lipoprotein YbaY
VAQQNLRGKQSRALRATAAGWLRSLARSWCVGWLIMIAAAGSGGAAEPAVSGQALYRERIALPPTAVFEAVLEDVSRADAPAEVLGEARVAPAGQVPIPFRIAYDPARIDPAHSYAVRARILVDGRLWFTTTDAYRVLTRGQGEQVELLLRRVSQSAEQATPGALGALPATFAGELPCADCPGIRYQLDLLQDGAFFFLRGSISGAGPITHSTTSAALRSLPAAARWS